MLVHTPSDNLGSPLRFSNVGMEGPKMSVSRMPVRHPLLTKAKARLTAIVDFPTPPFAEDTAMTFRTSLTGDFVGRPRCRLGSSGGALDRGRPLNIHEFDTDEFIE